MAVLKISTIEIILIFLLGCEGLTTGRGYTTPTALTNNDVSHDLRFKKHQTKDQPSQTENGNVQEHNTAVINDAANMGQHFSGQNWDSQESMRENVMDASSQVSSRESAEDEDDEDEDFGVAEIGNCNFGDVYLPLVNKNIKSCSEEKCHIDEAAERSCSQPRLESVDELCSITDTKANCSHRSLREVPSNLPEDITSLNLDFNCISRINETSFQRYPKLENLTLIANTLTSLDRKAFSGLASLKILDLYGNNLTMNQSSFPEDVFIPLQSLVCLRINRNNPNVTDPGLHYPDWALRHLTFLTKLHMDGLQDQEFSSGFSSLTQLRSLTLAGYRTGFCNMRSLTANTFKYVHGLQHLNIQDCRILGKYIDKAAFEPLTQLTKLNMIHNEDIDTPNMKKVFYGLRNSKLTSLNMRLNVNRYSIGICLNHEDIEYFPQHLVYLNAEENNIAAVDRSVIGMLSPTLKYLDISGNLFVFGKYLKDLPKMKNLTRFRLNGRVFDYKLPGIYPFEVTRTFPAENSTCNLYSSHEDDVEYEQFILTLPPNLLSVEMNNFGLTYILTEMKVDPNNKLQNISIRSNQFHELFGPITGLNSLRYFDISNSKVRYISRIFFQNFTTIEVLLLGSNNLGRFLASKENADVFLDLENLKTLNMSSNDIDQLTPGILDGLKMLESLVLSDNPIVNFNVKVESMPRLKLLDLANTRITTLSPENRNAINCLLDNKILVHMEQSMIACDCENFAFLQWMTSSKAFDANFTDYNCLYPDSSTKRIQDSYKETMSVLNKQCTTHTLLFLLVATTTVIIMCLIIGTVIYRFRWKLRYMYYAAYLHYRKTNKADHHRFEFDAFICYAEEDRRFVVDKLSPELEGRGLKVFVHDRDFVAGEFIASNIVKAVCKSRRTIVILSRHMVESYWCSYEIQMANMESLHTGRPVLVFLIMEQIPEKELGVELLYNIQNNTYIQYPGSDSLLDAANSNRLWDKLASDITS